MYNSAGNLVDLNGNEIDGAFLPPGHPGFPGFGPISAAQSLAYVADMQETGVPITYAYISDAHEKKTGQTGCSNGGTAQGPGDSCYEQNLAAYNSSFATFFQRLADDGINQHNTLFVFAADEGDHFAGANVGRAVTPACTGTPGAIDLQRAAIPRRARSESSRFRSTGSSRRSWATRRRSTTSRRGTRSSSRATPARRSRRRARSSGTSST